MEESWFESDGVVSRLATKGKDFSEQDKSALRKKQLEFLAWCSQRIVTRHSRGQIELSTTPFYHPIFP